MIRLKNNVPEVYVNGSRDFQLLCNLYDCIFNGFKADTDSIITVIDTNKCKTNILPLLQTKLGFFSNKLRDKQLRSVLSVFPDLIKYKGSKLGVEKALNAYLKAYNLNVTYIITVVSIEEAELYGLKIRDHTVVIGIDSVPKDTTMLEEMLAYIIPAGYECVVCFFKKVESNANQVITINSEVAKLEIYSDRSSQLRGTDHTYSGTDMDNIENRVTSVDNSELQGYGDIPSPTKAKKTRSRKKKEIENE